MYFGSVRFFKNLILLVVVLGIAIPTGLSIHYRNELRQVKQEKPIPLDMPQVEAYASPYQELYPDLYAPQPYHATSRETGTVYLTIEADEQTDVAPLLQILQEKEIKATFFVAGDVSRSGDMIKSIYEAGHTLGVLSASRDYLSIYASVENYLADIYPVFCAIKEQTGVAPTVFRFYGGSINSYNAGIYRQLIAEMIRRGFVPCDWNILLNENSADISALVDEAEIRMQSLDRAVIALPDMDTSKTEQLLTQLIELFQKQGFALAALDDTVKPILFAYTK